MKLTFVKYKAYKDSGIEWLGKVPEYWEVKRLKEVIVGSLTYGANETATDSNPSILDLSVLPTFQKMKS